MYVLYFGWNHIQLNNGVNERHTPAPVLVKNRNKKQFKIKVK